MTAPILQPVEEVWRHHRSALGEALEQALSGLRNLLRLDEYHRHGHDAGQLRHALGPVGSASLNLDTLSQVLGKAGGRRCLPPDRLQRVKTLLEVLQGHAAETAAAAPQCPSAGIEEDAAAILGQAETHYNRIAGIFRSLRMAQLEIRSKYEARQHDPLFARFDWRSLNTAELRLSPPFLVIAPFGGDSSGQLRKVIELLESRIPLKVVALRTGLRKAYPAAPQSALPATLSIETLPLALRGIHFLQTSPAAANFDQRLFEGLTAPRPAVLSLLCQYEDESPEAFSQRAERAMRARAFPVFRYDPDQSGRFVSCFDLSGNPSQDDGRACTFAHYAAAEPEFAGEFTAPPPGAAADNLVPVADYIELSPRQRIGKLPCVEVPDGDGRPRVKIVPPAVVTQTVDQLHLWKTLQEISGQDNPHVTATREAIHAELGAQQQVLLESLRQEMEAAALRREQVATATMVRKLVSHLTGVDAAEIDLRALLPDA